MKKNFLEWMVLKEENDLLNYDQKSGDVVYFGIHDLSRTYKEYGFLPKIPMSDVDKKSGIISSLDTIEELAKVAVEKAPFHYGYRKIETNTDKSKRFMREDGQMEVKIPLIYLKNINHLIDDCDDQVWLVIDSSTKYQKDLLKAIKKKNSINHSETTHFDPSIKSNSSKFKYFNEEKNRKYY